MAEAPNKKRILHGGNKSKKSKNDLIRAAVGNYLKEKSYVGSERIRKSDLVLQESKKQFVFNKLMEGDLMCGNSFLYSNVQCLGNNQHLAEQQFSIFSQFIEDQKDNIRLELRRLYAPVLCHLYLELLKAGEYKTAIGFLKKYAHLVATVENYEYPLPTKVNGCSVADVAAAGQGETTTVRCQIKFSKCLDDTNKETEFFKKLVQILSTYSKYDLAERNDEVRLFRCSKYELNLTEAAFNALHEFLVKKGHVLIMNLIYTWLHLHIVDNAVPQWSEGYLYLGVPEDDDEIEEFLREQQPDVSNDGKVKVDKVTTNEESNDDINEKEGREGKVLLGLKMISDCREQIYRTQSVFPRFVKVTERCRRLTSADIDRQECHLVAGFDSSVLQLWQMNQLTVQGKNIYQHHTDYLCQWELNNCYTEADKDEIDLAVQLNETNINERWAADAEEYKSRKYEENSIGDYGGIQLRGHSRGVTYVRFSTHYPLIYSVSKDTTMRTWRAETYSCAEVYQGHNYPVWCLDESPTGMYVATGSKDLTARLWAIDRDFPLLTYVGHTQDVECIAFHPNGNYIATGSADLSVRLWCVTSGKLVRVFTECKQPVASIAFSPDGKLLAAAGEESKIRIFDLAAGSQLAELKDLTAHCTSIAWSKRNQRIAAVCQDGTMSLWDVASLGTSNNSGHTTSSSSSPATCNRLMAMCTQSQRLVKVLFSDNETFSCIGN